MNLLLRTTKHQQTPSKVTAKNSGQLHLSPVLGDGIGHSNFQVFFNLQHQGPGTILSILSSAAKEEAVEAIPESCHGPKEAAVSRRAEDLQCFSGEGGPQTSFS